MKEQPCHTSVKRILLLFFCFALALFAASCGSKDAGESTAEASADNTAIEAIAENPADKTPLETIAERLQTVDAENQMFGTVSRIKKAGGGEFTADLRVYDWTEEKDGKSTLKDQESYEKITLTGDTTVVYATNSEPHGVVMSAADFQTNFVEGDYSIFTIYLNEEGKVDLIYSYSLIEQEE